ncbi:response regulator receiver domain protein [Anaerotignum neopropionicum]|uniref:Stage 0 sporulation protein A homolog n=1 Tax=Anaerotignum neopropionicum TaxID=36847 RepID=A0A136WCM4_9FIRM|nr:response regulator [Anaerotignum neopropionicum]KXL52257.1 response regulator receiver domain protein [Anaerotignum neopropionicum]
MNIALCAAFLEEDIWESRLLAATFPQKFEITECNSPRGLLSMLELKPFSLLVIVLNGVAGLEAVRQLRQKAPDVPILWISDEDYSLFGYQYHVNRFLRRPVSDMELREAITSCLPMGKEGVENEKNCIM